jgi:hypothetical protein
VILVKETLRKSLVSVADFIGLDPPGQGKKQASTGYFQGHSVFPSHKKDPTKLHLVGVASGNTNLQCYGSFCS